MENLREQIKTGSAECDLSAGSAPLVAFQVSHCRKSGVCRGHILYSTFTSNKDNSLGTTSFLPLFFLETGCLYGLGKQILLNKLVKPSNCLLLCG